MLRALAVPSHSSGLFPCKWSQLSANVGATSRSLTTKKTDAPVVKGQRVVAKAMRPSANGRPLATSAQILPDGFVKPALYDESTPIPRCEAYPSTYHMGTFPWLLSAERQRIPMEDLGASAAPPLAVDGDGFGAGTGAGLVGGSAQLLPLAARRRLAHALNMRIARAALGATTMDGVCDGAADVLPRVASLLSSASSGDAEAAEELSHLFTRPLLARYMRDLDSLRRDNVLLALEIHSVEGARIHQLRTQTGPEEAFAALESTGAGSSATLSAGLTRQSYRYTSAFGNTHAAPSHSPHSWPGDMVAAMGGQTPARVRVDVELLVDMRYRLIGRHSAPSKHDRHNGTTKVIVDDDATRNLMLTLESSVVGACGNEQPSFEWRVADIDYLLSSERRVQHELDEARYL